MDIKETRTSSSGSLQHSQNWVIFAEFRALPKYESEINLSFFGPIRDQMYNIQLMYNTQMYIIPN